MWALTAAHGQQLVTFRTLALVSGVHGMTWKNQTLIFTSKTGQRRENRRMKPHPFHFVNKKHSFLSPLVMQRRGWTNHVAKVKLLSLYPAAVLPRGNVVWQPSLSWPKDKAELSWPRRYFPSSVKAPEYLESYRFAMWKTHAEPY